MGERCVRNAQVEGSNPFISTISSSHHCGPFPSELSRGSGQFISRVSIRQISPVYLRIVFCIFLLLCLTISYKISFSFEETEDG